MKPMRVTIANLIAIVGFVAVAAAALRAGSEAWDCAWFGVTFVVLLVATLFVVHQRGSRQAFWVGFGLFGWAYFLASFVPSIETRLPSSKLLQRLDSMLAARVVTLNMLVINADGSRTVQKVNALSSDGTTMATNLQGPTTNLGYALAMIAGPGRTTQSFVQIGHLVFVWILAFLGGHLSRILYVRQVRRSTDPEKSI
jgi:hypothetical protein